MIIVDFVLSAKRRIYYENGLFKLASIRGAYSKRLASLQKIPSERGRESESTRMFNTHTTRMHTELHMRRREKEGKRCYLSDDERRVTGYTGGSVLLSCVCADPQSTVKTFTWRYYNSLYPKELFQNVKLSGRLKMFNETSPTNLSLLVSDLRKDDEGLYRCEIPFAHYRDIILTIKGCELLNNPYVMEIKAHAGESVVLPCYCNELQSKPEQHSWTYLNKTSTIIYSNVKSQRRNLVKLLNENFSGNLSLIISDLTHEHQGIYRCSVGSQYVDIKLIVEALRNLTNDRRVLNDEATKDELTYSAIVHKTAVKAAHRQIVTTELSDYATLK
ncbi:hypothetical protein E1301_Tti004286 [Triplophysa tibetana]|uniref:Ig-like domain-containing protein n=1 Tax=Triplophysa tibetana TaxID=1572043 RepID=A0A5A9N6A5_9TELE|nr:hypothetical protein E1301_Tti004286 [Triplophysa tibetana]